VVHLVHQEHQVQADHQVQAVQADHQVLQVMILMLKMMVLFNKQERLEHLILQELVLQFQRMEQAQLQ